MSLRTGPAVETWLAEASTAFSKLKEFYDLRDTWQFSIASIDLGDVSGSAAADVLENSAGAAAFMLRRVQGLHYLLSLDRASDNLEDLAVAYASDLGLYLTRLCAFTDLAEAQHELSRFKDRTIDLISALTADL